jgi:hypothetical protein
VGRKKWAPGAPSKKELYEAAFQTSKSSKLHNDILSIRRQCVQSRQHLENKGSENGFSPRQSHYNNEKKATYEKPWELKKSMTKCPADRAPKRAARRQAHFTFPYDFYIYNIKLIY